MSNLLNLKVMMRTVYMIRHLKTLQVNGIEILPLNPEDISLAAMERVVPEHLKHFLQCLCGASEHKLLKILSIAQSIIFASSDVQKRMPKQVGLGVSFLAAMETVVSEHLKHFLQCLCGASEHKLLKILSITQIIIFVSSDVQKKMPKQVGLGVSLKASLRSREYIILLNKFGEV